MRTRLATLALAAICAFMLPGCAVGRVVPSTYRTQRAESDAAGVIAAASAGSVRELTDLLLTPSGAHLEELHSLVPPTSGDDRSLYRVAFESGSDPQRDTTVTAIVTPARQTAPASGSFTVLMRWDPGFQGEILKDGEVVGQTDGDWRVVEVRARADQ